MDREKTPSFLRYRVISESRVSTSARQHFYEKVTKVKGRRGAPSVIRLEGLGAPGMTTRCATGFRIIQSLEFNHWRTQDVRRAPPHRMIFMATPPVELTIDEYRRKR